MESTILTLVIIHLKCPKSILHYVSQHIWLHSELKEAKHSILWKFYTNFIYFDINFILTMLATVSNFIIYILSLILIAKGIRPCAYMN